MTGDLELVWAKAQEQSHAELPAIRNRLQHVKSRPLKISRVGQLDAQLLDTELENVLREPVSRAFQDFRVRLSCSSYALADANNGNRAHRIRRLMKLNCRLSCVTACSACLCTNPMRHMAAGCRTSSTETKRSTSQDVRSAAPASFLMLIGLSIDPAISSAAAPQRFQVETYAALSVLPEYLSTKLRDYMLANGWADYPMPKSSLALFLPKRASESSRDFERRKRERKRWAWNVYSRFEKIWAAARLLNFLVFLYNGR